MQSGLVELFDQLRELRRRLDAANIELPAEIKPAALFSEVSRISASEKLEGHSISSSPVKAPLPEKVESTTSESDHESISTSETDHSVETKPSDIDSASITAARVARLLDPIAHELNTGEAPAEILAEYLLAAKEYLITKENPNEKVARDMDVVLKFLHARGKRGIRDEERDNILRRIKRWKAHLST